MFFWSNPYKIEVMTTSVIDMLELLNFDHMTTSRISHVMKFCWLRCEDKLWRHDLYFKIPLGLF